MHSKKKEVLNKPIMFTEFGADAFNVINVKIKKSRLIICWVMEENMPGLGKAGNAIGVYFQFSDGWWKWQTKNLDIHDNNASWFNGTQENG
jgi:hypothetical protein